MNLRDQVEQEALAANRAGPSLTDEAVAEALRAAAALVRERREEILGANAADCEGAAGQLDEGTLDRLRLDGARVEAISVQVEATAAIEPLEREVGEWTLANGLHVSERRGRSSNKPRRDRCEVCDPRHRGGGRRRERSGAILSACICYIGSGIVLPRSTSLTATRTPTGSIHEDTSIRFLPPLRLLDRRSSGTSIRLGT